MREIRRRTNVVGAFPDGNSALMLVTAPDSKEFCFPAKRKNSKNLQLLCEKNPRQLKLPFAQWNRKAIQSVIYKLWRVRIAIRTIGDYMRRWGFTPQKPIKKAYEQSPKAVQEWLDHTYPEIKKLAKKENAQIYWGDETGVRNDCQHSRGMRHEARHLWLKSTQRGSR